MPQTTPNPQQNLTADELQAASAAATTATTGNIENITIIDQAIQGCLGTIEQEREQEILTRRFGLNGKKETLEQIGGLLSITRERVRQLEKVILVRLRISSDENLIPNLSQAEKLMIRNLVELGRVAPTTTLAERIFGRPADQASVAKLNFIADISSLLTLVRSNDSYHEAIGIAEYGTELDIRAKVDEVVAAVRAHKKPILLEDLFEQLNGYEHPSFVAAVASVSKKLAHRGNLWGLSTWPEVNPRNIRDKIFMTLTLENHPMHFSKIAEAIDQNNQSGRHVTVQAVHNELIKDKRFILVGRGIYALNTWGYKKGTVAEVVQQILAENGEPMTKEEIIKAVLRDRQVKETTILLALQNRKIFKRLDRDRYTLVATS